MYPIPEVIYCLAEHNDGEPFYVGRAKDWTKRFKEHRHAAKRGTEAKYQHIRKLWAKGSDFEIVVLEENPGKRYEKYYHYLLGCEYDLTNQKMGDSWATEQAIHRKLRVAGRVFCNPTEFLTALDIEIAEEKARKKAAKVQARIRKKACNLVDTERTLFVGENPNTKFTSPGLQAIRKRNEKEIQHPTNSNHRR